MHTLTFGSFLFWLAIVILVPGLVVHFTLGRKGGHHHFDKDKLSTDQIKNLPLEMTRKRTIWKLKGAVATIAGLAVALMLYPLACLLGLRINVLGISDEKLIYSMAGSITLLLTIGPAIYYKCSKKK